MALLRSAEVTGSQRELLNMGHGNPRSKMEMGFRPQLEFPQRMHQIKERRQGREEAWGCKGDHRHSALQFAQNLCTELYSLQRCSELPVFSYIPCW